MIPKGADSPRYEWRGVMLDVARHFFGVDDVKRFVDVIARYGFNRLHLHLTDDQGWRIEIKSWPRLAEVGGSTAVGGGPGGWYTQDEYAELVAFAAERGIVVVPEIDLPGHVNAALVAYPELAPAGYSPEPYTGTDVGFSSLDVTNERTYEFVEDVVREVAALTPGRSSTSAATRRPRRRPRTTSLSSSALADDRRASRQAARRLGGDRAREPAAGNDRAALEGSGARRAGRRAGPGHRHVARLEDVLRPEVRRVDGARNDVGRLRRRARCVRLGSGRRARRRGGAVVGDARRSLADVEFMAFPRLLALAEVASAPADERDWEDFRARLAEHEPELAALGVNFFRSPEIPWR